MSAVGGMGFGMGGGSSTRHIVVVDFVVNSDNAGLKKIKMNADDLKKSFGFFKTLGMDFQIWKANTAAIAKHGGGFAKLANRIRMATHGLRGFKMELLGIMFFGMGMQRFFSGMLKPALELVGLFDMWKTTLQVLFLPIALAIFQFLMPFMKWIINMSPETKLLIGKLVLFGLAIGTVLMIIGMFLLGIGAIIMAFSGLFNILDKLIPDIEVAGVNMSSFVEAGIGMALMSKLASGVSSVFGKILEKLLGMDMIKDLFKKMGVEIDNTKTPLENFKALFTEIWDYVKEKFNINAEGGIIESAITKVEDAFLEMKNKVSTYMTEMGLDKAIESVKGMAKSMNDALPSIESMAASLKTVADAIEKVTSALKKMKDAWNNRPKFDSSTSGSYDILGQRIPSPSSTQIPIGEGSSRGGVTFSPTYNISTKSDEDIKKLVSRETQLGINKLSRNNGATVF
jgi:hypothetical protein